MRVLATSRAVVRPLQITGLWDLLHAEQVTADQPVAQGRLTSRPAPSAEGPCAARFRAGADSCRRRSRRSGRTTVREHVRAVICEPLRTPVGGFGGSLRDVPAQELAATVIRALMERTGLPPESVEDVLLGHCYPTMDAPAIGRVAALDAGLPVTASGLQIDRRCGSGLQAVLYAAMQVQSGASDLVLAGGAESMSNAPFYSTAMRWGVKAGPGRAAAGRPGPRPGDRRRPEPPGARRHDRDGGEPARASTRSRARSRTSTPSAATSARPPPPRPAGSPTRSCRSP